MAKIEISDLQLNGSDLFVDSEGFMMNLSNDELTMNYGGSTPAIPVALGVGFVAGFIASRAAN